MVNMIETDLRMGLQKKIEQYQDVETVVSPWSDQIDPKTRAEVHQYLLGVVYGKGHPALTQPLESLIEAQQSGRMLTWLMYVNGQPVGMANIEVLPDEGIAELCRTVRLPIGSILPDGTTLNGQVNNTVVMYQRLLDFLQSPIANTIWALQADLRLAKSITLPDGSFLESGAATQHINQFAGLNPWLLCVPRYQVHPKGGLPHQEVFFQSRLYLQPEGLNLQTPLYTPENNHYGSVSNAEIANATYRHAFGIQPTIVGDINQEEISPPKLNLESTAGIHFSTIHVEGEVNPDQLLNLINTALQQSRFVEVIIPNKPTNIITQNICYQLGLIPLGVLPGGEFRVNGQIKTIPTTFHFGMAKPEIRKQIVDIELARDYHGGEIEKLTYLLHHWWKNT